MSHVLYAKDLIIIGSKGLQRVLNVFQKRCTLSLKTFRGQLGLTVTSKVVH